MKNNDFIYLPSNYFGTELAFKMKINTENTILVGKLTNTLKIENYIWHEVLIFLTNERIWIIKDHLTILPPNTNIILGKSYINENNKHRFLIKNNIGYFDNNLLEFQNKIKENMILSHCHNIKFEYFT